MSENNEKKEPVKDVSKEYEKQLSYYRPGAQFLLILMLICFMLPFIAMALGFIELIAPYLPVILFFPVVLAILPVWMMGKCPSCRAYMGKTPGNFCPKCGVRIRPENGKD